MRWRSSSSVTPASEIPLLLEVRLRRLYASLPCVPCAAVLLHLLQMIDGARKSFLQMLCVAGGFLERGGEVRGLRGLHQVERSGLCAVHPFVEPLHPIDHERYAVDHEADRAERLEERGGGQAHGVDRAEQTLERLADAGDGSRRIDGAILLDPYLCAVLAVSHMI